LGPSVETYVGEIVGNRADFCVGFVDKFLESFGEGESVSDNDSSSDGVCDGSDMELGIGNLEGSMVSKFLGGYVGDPVGL